MEVDGETVHRAELDRGVLGADEVGEEWREGVLAACPRQLPRKVPAHAEIRPLIRLDLEGVRSRARHQTERVAGHVGELARAVRRDVEPRPQIAQRVRRVHRRSELVRVERKVGRTREDAQPCMAIAVGGGGEGGKASAQLRRWPRPQPPPEQVSRRSSRRRSSSSSSRPRARHRRKDTSHVAFQVLGREHRASPRDHCAHWTVSAID